MAHAAAGTDPLRKAVIVGVLVAGVILLHRFAIPSGDIDPTGMLALGFVILAGYTIGELGEVVKLPHVTGYLLGGLLLGTSFAHALPGAWQVGPFEHGILNEGVLEQLSLLDTLALALIALTAGGELKLDGLRRDIRPISGVLVGQVLTVPILVMALVWAISGAIPLLALDALGELTTAKALAFGGLIAAVSIATSPSATIAVINGSNASGPMTRTVLSTVVLKDVVVVTLFSIVTVLAADALGEAAIEGSLGPYLLLHIGGSLLVGVLLGGGLALYLRFVGAEILLFLVGLVYTATYIAQGLGLDPLLLFIAAGFATSNFSREGDKLIHNVERLSLPVYVVFFTLAGAKLPLGTLAALAPYAIALLLVRALGLWIGVKVGARVGRADPATRRYGWMGFLSQAGVSISLAILIGRTYGAEGRVIETLLVATLALNEIFGPVLLKVGLGLAGELERKGGPEVEHEEDLPEETTVELTEEDAAGFEGWKPPAHLPDPWGPPPGTASQRLEHLTAELEADLQGLLRDLLQGPLAEMGARSTTFLRTLRREFLRHHRRTSVRVQAETEAADAAAFLRLDQSEIAEGWRSLVLDRAARVTKEGWSPARLVEAVDRVVDALPEVVEAPLEPRTLGRHDESPVAAVQRGWLRLRDRWSRMVGRGGVPRAVRYRDLAHYHLGGPLPLALEPLAALLVNADLHLANRVRHLFDVLVHGHDEVAALAERLSDVAPEERLRRLDEALQQLRTDLEEELAVANQEVDHIAREGTLRAAVALGDALRGIKEDLPIIGTVDLPDRARRFSRVFSARTEGLELLTTRLEAARRGTAGRWSVLGLELELVGLEARIKQAVERHGTQLARLMRGKGPTQLDRVSGALHETLARLDGHLRSESTAHALSEAIRASTESLEHLVAEASRAAQELHGHLADDQGVSPLLEELLGAARSLTDRYTVPTGRMLRGERTLPAPPGTAEVPTRELAIAFIESSVSRDLVTVSRDLAREVEKLVRALEELERVVAFNAELAGGELDVLGKEQVPPETRGIVREMLVGALGRSRDRIEELRSTAAAWDDEARAGVRNAVLGDLESFRAQLVDGRVTELRLRLLRQRAAAGGRLAREAGELRGGLRRLGKRLDEAAVTALGRERLDQLRHTLGLPLSTAIADPTPQTFAAPGDPERLPVVYRRLFSDQALEAGDLLTGRQAEIARARRALTGADGGRLRTVAIVGLDGVGKGAVVNALVRGISATRVTRIHLSAPVTEDQVAAWFEDVQEGELVVVQGLPWMFAMRPGGFAPLRRFVDGVIATGGRASWVVHASLAVWSYAARATPLQDAFPEVIHLRPLDPAQLASAVLARHTMSGYKLSFEAQEDLSWQLQHLLARTGDQQERHRDAWFATLHAATGGVVHDALTYWMASIRRVDASDGVVRVGPVPRPPLTALRNLPDDVLLTLCQVMRQGWLDPALHAESFRTSVSASSAHLARLAHFGLLQAGGERYHIAPHLVTPIWRILSERGWT